MTEMTKMFSMTTQSMSTLLLVVAMISLGTSASLLVRWQMHWPTQASLSTIVAAVAVSVGVGIAFGFYPAWKALRLDPSKLCGTSERTAALLVKNRTR